MQDLNTLIEAYPVTATLAGTLLLVLTALFANFLVKVVLLRVFDRLIGRTAYGRDAELRNYRVIARLANIVPAMVLSVGIALVPGMPTTLAVIVRNVSNAFIILTIALALSAALSVAETIYRRRADTRYRSIRGYVQVAKLVLFAVAAILMIATVMDRSPIILLSGLGAMAAVLILVFQDTLLSFVASIQINSTDMVRIGDWIEMPDMQADGAVVEIALHTVKVQNWDKTITTVPIRKLVTDPFKNWRGMQESGGRRIKRSLYLDQNTIRFLDGDDLVRLRSIALLSSYLAQKEREMAEWNAKLGEDSRVAANTRRATNIGTFRAYIGLYLASHPGIHQEMTQMVRQLQPTPEGLPLEIYCFTATTAWVAYEGIQSDIFDHLYAILGEFGLQAFQQPSGHDLAAFASGGEAGRSRLSPLDGTDSGVDKSLAPR